MVALPHSMTISNVSPGEADGSTILSEAGARLGAYRLESLLGQGGMGEVWAAWDERLQRRVAIKRVRRDLQTDDARRQRFRREARAVAQLNHPAIVQVFDLLTLAPTPVDDGEIPVTEDILVMEYVEGRSLAHLLATSAVDLDTALALAAEIAGGLAQAHGAGILHRDLKAENVLVTPAGHAKILDFGLARRLWEPTSTLASVHSSVATHPGTLVGTIHAMSPEQASGRPVDHRSDLFALGSLLYEMLSARAPFRGEHWLDALRRVTSEEPESLALLRPDVPLPVVELVEELLAKEPSSRPPNAQVVAQRLQTLRQNALPPNGAAGSSPTAIVPAPGNAPVAADEPTGEWPLAGSEEETDAGALPQAVVQTLLRVEVSQRDGLLRRHGEAAAAALASLDHRLRELVARFEGVEVERGDALVALFQRPIQGVACALAQQRAAAERTAAGEIQLTLGAAVHLGEMWVRRNAQATVALGAPAVEVEGLARGTVNLLGRLAGSGQVLLSRGAFDLARRSVSDVIVGLGQVPGSAPSETLDTASSAASPRDLSQQGALRWLAHGPYQGEGRDEPLEVFEVALPGMDLRGAPPDTSGIRRVLSPQQERMLGWRPAAGQTIPRREHWTLTERLGEGGFGEVWLARHRSEELRVFKFCFEAQRLKALKREVTLFRLLRDALGHRDDITRILDWQFDHAPFFIESEYTEGGSLTRWAEEQGGLSTVPLELRLALAADVAVALAAAHSVGILHKDVKPENVLVTVDRTGSPRARLTDFGIGLLTDPGRLQGTAIGRLGFTATASPDFDDSGAGTAGYMAPELLRGQAATVQADLYSLGVLLYQLAVGDLSRALAPGWERDVDDELLAEDIAQFVDGDPSRRPASAQEVAHRVRTLDERRSRRSEDTHRRVALQRAHRRRRVASIVAAGALVLATVVGVMAWRESQARRAAEAAEEQAGVRQRQAENLIDFMIDDLQDKMREVGRLELLQEVADKAQEYFAAVPSEELSSLEVSRRSKALIRIGEIAMAEGEPDKAMAAFGDSLRLIEGLVTREPEQSEWLSNLGVSHFWVGAVHWNQGRSQDALASFERQLDMQRRALELEPANEELKKQYAYALSNLGFVRRAEGDLDGALDLFLKSLRLKRQLTPPAPEQPDLQLDLMQQLTLVGSCQAEVGQPARAESHFREALEIAELVQATDPENTLWKQHRATLHNHFGRLLGVTRTDSSHAREHFDTSLALWRELTALEPDHAEWYSQLAVVERRRGDHSLERQRTSEARPHLVRAYELGEQLLQQDATHRDWRLELAVSATSLGRLEALEGRAAVGERYCQRAMDLLEELLEQGSGNPIYQRRFALVHEVRALVEAARGNHAAAEIARAEAIDQLRPLAELSRDFEVLSLWIRLLVNAGREEEARREMRKLERLGYVAL